MNTYVYLGLALVVLILCVVLRVLLIVRKAKERQQKREAMLRPYGGTP